VVPSSSEVTADSLQFDPKCHQPVLQKKLLTGVAQMFVSTLAESSQQSHPDSPTGNYILSTSFRISDPASGLPQRRRDYSRHPQSFGRRQLQAKLTIYIVFSPLSETMVFCQATLLRSMINGKGLPWVFICDLRGGQES
jgi:hypothetical protein